MCNSTEWSYESAENFSLGPVATPKSYKKATFNLKSETICIYQIAYQMVNCL